MKFSQRLYTRPDLTQTIEAFTWLNTQLQTADTADAQLDLFASFETLSRNISTMHALAEIRHTIDTTDAFYETEAAFWDENSPTLADKELEIYKTLLTSPYREELQESLGALAFEKMEVEIKSQTPQVLELMAQENALTTEYQKLYAGAQIVFDGKLLTISEMSPYKMHADRAVRKSAYEAEGMWFATNSKTLDRLYDALVKNRTQQAKIMGYDNFIQLGAIRMHRVGYTLEDMAQYRAQIKKDVVPMIAYLKQLQFKRTHVTDPKYYDDAFCFLDGNPQPQGTPDEIMQAGKTMYHSLSAETAAFIDEMFAADCFDVLSKPGKAPGGYCTYLPDYKLPFVFSNFNATSQDVDVLTHEAGHAFAAWVAAKKEIPAVLEEPGMESCEIHSMSMEFLTSDYHHLFFGKETAKYELSHAEDALYFLPYGTMVDEFQHMMYANPDFTPQQRNETWAALEKEYRPWIDFEKLPFYSGGAGWQRQLHIYEMPFYYIDYCLAQSVALQFFLLHQEDSEKAWQKYLDLVEAAGTKTYPQLIKAAGLTVPFEEHAMRNLVRKVAVWVEHANETLIGE